MNTLAGTTALKSIDGPAMKGWTRDYVLFQLIQSIFQDDATVEGYVCASSIDRESADIEIIL